MEEAVKSEDIETIETLLLEGFNPNEAATPLLFQTENKNIIKLLLDYGADIFRINTVRSKCSYSI